MENSKQPINPVPYINRDGSIQHDVLIGLTKREYFAGLAMQGLMVQAIAGSHNCNNEMNNFYTAEHAVAMADALLNALSK